MSEQPIMNSILAAMVIVLLFCVIVDGDEPEVGIKFNACRKDEENPLTSFQLCVRDMVENLIRDTHSRDYNYYLDIVEGEKWECHGQAYCKTHLTAEQCISCLTTNNMIRLKRCKFAMGARVLLDDCYMRVENYDFKWEQGS